MRDLSGLGKIMEYFVNMIFSYSSCTIRERLDRIHTAR